MGTIASEAALKAIIRNRCDGADTTLLPDAALDQYLDDAVERLNELNPRLMLSTLTTVANTQGYQLTGDGASLTGFRNVEDVLYDTSDSGFLADEFPEFFSLALYSPSDDGISLFDNPSLSEIYYRKVKAWDRSYAGGWEVYQSGSEWYLRLIPAPGSVQTVPYLWWQTRSLTDMESQFQQKLVDLASAYCLQSIGRRLSMHPEVDIAGLKGKSDGAHLIKHGEKLEAKTESRLIDPSSLYPG